MLIKTRGIIFRSQKYSESSLIVDIYTEERGLQSYIVSGVRSKKAKVNASLLQVMSLVEIVAYARDDRKLNRIREIKPAQVYRSIPFDVQRGAVGLFMAEVARKALRESEPNAKLFEFLFHNFLFLDTTDGKIGNIHLHFLCHLTLYLGFWPDGVASRGLPYFDMQEGIFVAQPPGHPYFLSEEQSVWLSQLLRSELGQCGELSLSREERRLLLGHLIDFYRLHIDDFPAILSHQVLEEVLGG